MRLLEILQIFVKKGMLTGEWGLTFVTPIHRTATLARSRQYIPLLELQALVVYHVGCNNCRIFQRHRRRRHIQYHGCNKN